MEQALERTLWAHGMERALKRTLWAHGSERTLWDPGQERALEQPKGTPQIPETSGVQPPHSPPIEGLLKGTIEEVLEGRIIVPQALGCPTEPQGKLP